MTTPDDAGRAGWYEPTLQLLCKVEAQLASGLSLANTPAGSRLIAEVLSGRFEGERIKASLKGRAAADWLIVSHDGRLGLMDVRCTIETDDGALIYLQYNGRVRIFNPYHPCRRPEALRGRLPASSAARRPWPLW